MDKVINVLLCDDHILVGDAVAQILDGEGDFRVTTCRSLPEALEALTRARYEIALLDLLMPGMVGLPSIERVIASSEGAKVVLFSGNASADLTRKAVASGAAGFIPKTLPIRSLPAALRLVYSGQVFMPVGAFDAPVAAQDSADRTIRLSTLHLDILRMVREGKTNKEIARSIANSETGVKMHLRSIFDKLQAKNRAHAVTIAAEHGLI